MNNPNTYITKLMAFLILLCLPQLAFTVDKQANAVSKSVNKPLPVPIPLCLASPTWLSPANKPPTEIGNGIPVGQETNCQFYQFAWQWYLSLLQPSASGDRVFETFNLLQPNQNNQCSQAKLTGKKNVSKAIFARTSKKATASFDPVLPEDIEQATQQVLYDQAGNIVLYNVWYNDIECQATSQGFQPNTIEIKTSWRQLSKADPSYYTITATVPAVSKQTLTLGLVGFHLVMNTATHPEFVWATFEHNNNAPNCTSPQATPADNWSFTSAACAGCLATQTLAQCNAPPTSCNFNTGINSQSLTGTPNQVCRVYPDGTDPGTMTNGNNNQTNRENVDWLNSQLVGPKGMLATLPASNPLSVFKNYFLVGGLWTNGGVDSNPPNEQRGSLELANTSMETFAQQPQTNCFSCHHYIKATPLKVSHIISSLISTMGTEQKNGSDKSK
jgi:hypothetical protein